MVWKGGREGGGREEEGREGEGEGGEGGWHVPWTRVCSRVSFSEVVMELASSSTREGEREGGREG